MCECFCPVPSRPAPSLILVIRSFRSFHPRFSIFSFQSFSLALAFILIHSIVLSNAFDTSFHLISIYRRNKSTAPNSLSFALFILQSLILNDSPHLFRCRLSHFLSLSLPLISPRRLTARDNPVLHACNKTPPLSFCLVIKMS